MVPANEVVAKLLVDFISSLLLPVCRLQKVGIDIPSELSKKSSIFPVPVDGAAKLRMAFR
jgi:hypothetical protein